MPTIDGLIIEERGQGILKPIAGLRPVVWERDYSNGCTKDSGILDLGPKGDRRHPRAQVECQRLFRMQNGTRPLAGSSKARYEQY
jgi:hypothetical protein